MSRIITLRDESYLYKILTKNQDDTFVYIFYRLHKNVPIVFCVCINNLKISCTLVSIAFIIIRFTVIISEFKKKKTLVIYKITQLK